MTLGRRAGSGRFGRWRGCRLYYLLANRGSRPRDFGRGGRLRERGHSQCLREKALLVFNKVLESSLGGFLAFEESAVERGVLLLKLLQRGQVFLSGSQRFGDERI